MKNTAFTALLSAIISAFLMGVLGYFVIESHVSSAGCAFARFFIGLVLLLGLFAVMQRRTHEKLQLSKASLGSGVAISLCIFFYFFAIKETSVGVAAFLLYLGPIFATIADAIIQRKMPGKVDLSLILVALAGLILVSFWGPASTDAQASENFHKTLFGNCLGVLSGLFYAAYIVLNRHIAPEISIPQRTLWQFVAGTLVMAVLVCCTPAPFANLSTGWPYVIVIGICQGFLVLLLVAYAVKHLRPITFGTLSYLEPVVALGLGYFVYRESIAGAQWVGFVFIISAALIQTLFHIKTQTIKEIPHENG